MLASAACAGDGPVTAPEGDPLLARVAAMGFDISGIVDAGDHFVVEGDILLRKADIPAAAARDPLAPSFQYRTTNRVSYTYYYDLRVDYTSVTASNPAWTAAIEQAMAAWNSLPGSEAKLVKWEPGQYYGPHITIAFGSCPSGAIACASWPSSAGAPGPTINIAQQFETQKVYTIAHELGHTLGLRHTNWNNRTCNGSLCSEGTGTEGAVHIPNTPTSTYGGSQSDPNSVMNAVVQSWNGFSQYDRVAVRYLFPGGRGPDATSSLSGSTPVSTWSPMLDAVSYEVYYQDWEMVPDIIFGSWPQRRETYLGTTTGTTWTDYSRSFTNSNCVDFWPSGYVVKAVFADGVKTHAGGLACFY